MRYFIADTHFAHKKILSITNRPYKTIEEHDQSILNFINKTTGEKGELYILGDFAFDTHRYYRKKIIAHKVHLILGNHDLPYIKELAMARFTSISETFELKANGKKLFGSHYPHFYWPASHHGSYHIYGHLHGMREETMDSLIPERRSMDVGIDCAIRHLGEPRPFSEDEIFSILERKPGHDPVKWYQEKRGESTRTE